jgi:RNA polymerase sigma factor (sigma-70 family)
MPAAATPPSIATLYQDHHGWLQGWLRGKLGNASQAADLAHDTYVRLLQSRRAEFGQQPRAFLTHVAKGLLVDHWRRQEVERAYLDTIALLPEAQSPSPETRLLVLETLYRVETMLRAMPAQTREIFLMAQLDELSYQQIADRRRTSLATVKRHMRAAFLACMAAA